jgi:hypothetical protein
MTVITMSRTELSRLRVMIDLADGRTRVEDAAALNHPCSRMFETKSFS